MAQLYEQIGRLRVELSWLKKVWTGKYLWPPEFVETTSMILGMPPEVVKQSHVVTLNHIFSDISL